MSNMSFDWQIDEFMVSCRSRQLGEKTMLSYAQAHPAFCTAAESRPKADRALTFALRFIRIKDRIGITSSELGT